MLHCGGFSAGVVLVLCFVRVGFGMSRVVLGLVCLGFAWAGGGGVRNPMGCGHVRHLF